MEKRYKTNIFMKVQMIIGVFFMFYIFLDLGFTFFKFLFLLFLNLLTVMLFFMKVDVNDNGLHVQMMWKQNQLKWEEIKQIEYKVVRGVSIYTIVTENEEKIRISLIERMGELLSIISINAVNAKMDYRIKRKIAKYQRKHNR